MTSMPCRVSVSSGKGEIGLGGERMKEVKEFNHLGIVLSRHGGMERERSERVVKGRTVIGAVEKGEEFP